MRFLEEMIARLFGQRNAQPIRVPVDEDEQRGSDVMKGRK